MANRPPPHGTPFVNVLEVSPLAVDRSFARPIPVFPRRQPPWPTHPSARPPRPPQSTSPSSTTAPTPSTTPVSSSTSSTRRRRKHVAHPPRRHRPVHASPPQPSVSPSTTTAPSPPSPSPSSSHRPTPNPSPSSSQRPTPTTPTTSSTHPSPTTTTPASSPRTRSSKRPSTSTSSPSSSSTRPSKSPRPSTTTTTTASTLPLLRGKFISSSTFSASAAPGFLDKLRRQGWFNCFTSTTWRCDDSAVREFYRSCRVQDAQLVAFVRGHEVTLTASKVARHLNVPAPATGFSTYLKLHKEQLHQEDLLRAYHAATMRTEHTEVRRVTKKDMIPLYQLCFSFLIHSLLPRAQGRYRIPPADLILLHKLVREDDINFPELLIRHIGYLVSDPKPHVLAYGFFITHLLEAEGVPLEDSVSCSAADCLSTSTLLGCGYEQPRERGGERVPNSAGPAESDVHSRLDAIEGHLREVREDISRFMDITEARYEDLRAQLRSLRRALG